ncbi:MFS transporter [Ochrobactrum teleogrylli]|uniref:MFS transporter n=1 Tax=Ochrobactrum teleogrylli TaxID=2479765 RepID=UPI00384B6DA6
MKQAIYTADEKKLFQRITWRIVPLVVFIYLIAIIDRANVGFAKLQMVSALDMTEQLYGLASSLFFIGYLALEIPSAYAVNRFGARLWLARILLTWGLLTIATAWVTSGSLFAAFRFLIGCAEAGAYPGIIYYFTLWFPKEYRARVLGFLTLGSAFGNLFGSLVSGFLLDLDGFLGFAGWQWVFLATGLPAVLLTPLVLVFLPNGPDDAKFISTLERKWLRERLGQETPDGQHGNPLAVIWDRRVLLLAIIYMLILASLYGVIYWLPTVVRGFGVSGTENGLLSAIPWVIGACALVVVPRHLRKEKTVLTAMIAISCLGLVCFYLSTGLPENWMRMVAMSIGTPCISLLFPCLWFLPSLFFSGQRVAMAIAAISTIGNLGGFIAQNLMPWVANAAGTPVAAMLVPASALALVGLLASLIKIAGFTNRQPVLAKERRAATNE